MKKIKILIPLLGLTLISCNSNGWSSHHDSDYGSLPYIKDENCTMVVPTGAPALAFYDYANKNLLETNSDPTNIVAMMSAGQKDVVVLPTNVGIKTIITAQAPYKIAATITFGNFFVASLNNDDNNEMDASDNIVLFQRNNVPDKIFHYIYGDALDSGIHYVNSVSDASMALNAGTFTDAESGNTLTANYVLIAQPALYSVISKKENVTVYADLQEEYREKSEDLDIFQASIFVKNDYPRDEIDYFLDNLEEDIINVISNPSRLSGAFSIVSEPQTFFGISLEAAQAVLANGSNGLGLGFKLARDNKAAIDTFLSLFNIEETDETIYY